MWAFGAASAGMVLFGEGLLAIEKQQTTPRDTTTAQCSHPAQILLLSSGRRLCFKEHGNISLKHKRAIVYLHGLGGSRLEFFGRDRDPSAAAEYVVTIDRPGSGYSDHQPGRTYESFARDIGELMDHLAVDKFAVVGWSSGCCYALACARFLDRRRLTHVVTVAGDTDWYRASWKCFTFGHVILYFLVHFFPLLIHLLFHFASRLAVAATAVFPKQRRLHERLVQAFRQGFTVENIVQEMTMERSDWGFRLEDIDHPAVTIWHGTADNVVHPNCARNIAERLGGKEVRLLPGQGHFIISSHWRQICDAIWN